MFTNTIDNQLIVFIYNILASLFREFQFSYFELLLTWRSRTPVGSHPIHLDSPSRGHTDSWWADSATGPHRNTPPLGTGCWAQSEFGCRPVRLSCRHSHSLHCSKS